LYLKTKGLWKDVLVHESVTMSDDARTAKLSGDLLHHSIPNAAYHHRLLGERYAPLAARQMFDNKRKTSDFKIMTVGATTFLSQYLLKGGFRDGLPGFCAAKFSAHHAFLKHLLLRELQENNDE
ncbi:MAG: hypothetical protein H7Z37_13610, partial [Pyrinomonadaceae bacterium]|nr:hypothetical protein [Pyrinomonadaceae bacterium]